jgi:hypothetical protein
MKGCPCVENLSVVLKVLIDPDGKQNYIASYVSAVHLMAHMIRKCIFLTISKCLDFCLNCFDINIKRQRFLNWSSIFMHDFSSVTLPAQRIRYPPRCFTQYMGTNVLLSVIKHCANKPHGEVDVWIHIFLISALVGGEWSVLRTGLFTPREKSPCYSLDRRLSGRQKHSGRRGGKKYVTHTETRTLKPRPSIPCPVPVTTALSGLLMGTNVSKENTPIFTVEPSWISTVNLHGRQNVRLC